MSRAEFYRLVSAVIRDCVEHASNAAEKKAFSIVARKLSLAFMLHNSKFDPERFYRDAGL